MSSDSHLVPSYKAPSKVKPDPKPSSNLRDIFDYARTILNPGCFFHTILHLFAERKLLVFFGIHFVSTMIVWTHFALIKYEQKIATVPEEANRYTWKVTIPSLEFGSMHAILFQMALIPLTMSRFSISALSDSFVNAIVPLNRSLRMHIHLGYTMVLIVALATAFFFGFFGMLCADGEEKFCKMFTSEIMLTGYSILFSLLVIGGTSYFRHVIPYEIFYAIHHLVFIMYFITILHTFDNDQRAGRKERSQTFKWFSSTLLFYFCDRAAMYLNHRYRTKIVGYSTVSAGEQGGSKMIILKVNRPLLFQFKPGQYAFLHVKGIDPHWHPFSIGSRPNSSDLDFYIEVFGKDSWSDKLWKYLVANTKKGQDGIELPISVMGPYGTSLANTENFSHGLALGAGTGIVPIMSLLKQHVKDMLKYDPRTFFEELSARNKQVRSIELARERLKGSLAQKLKRVFFSRGGATMDRSVIRYTRNDILRNSIKRGFTDLLAEGPCYTMTKLLVKEASRATSSLYGTVALSFTPVMGVAVVAFTISWNTIPLMDGLYFGMAGSLQVFTYVFQAVFFAISFFVWDAVDIWSYLDLAFSVIAPFADWYWFLAYRANGSLTGPETTLACLLNGYMTMRLWVDAVGPRQKSWKSFVDYRGRGSTTMDCLKVVWTTPSAAQASEILPDLVAVWKRLSDRWGAKNARNVCRITIHVTDKDSEACEQLRKELVDSKCPLTVHFHRLDIPKWIQDHTVELAESDKIIHSSTLLAFCGSPELASVVRGYKISNDTISAMTGYKQHQMEFVSESYGGQKKKKSLKKTKGVADTKSFKLSMSKDEETGNGADTVVTSTSEKSTSRHMKRTPSQSSLVAIMEDAVAPVSVMDHMGNSAVSGLSLDHTGKGTAVSGLSLDDNGSLSSADSVESNSGRASHRPGRSLDDSRHSFARSDLQWLTQIPPEKKADAVEDGPPVTSHSRSRRNLDDSRHGFARSDLHWLTKKSNADESSSQV